MATKTTSKAAPSVAVPSATKNQSKIRKSRVRKSVVRDARLDVRLPRAAKERIETAAALSCQTLAEFTSSVLLREAEQVIERNRIIAVSEEHWKKVLEALDNPLELNDFVKRGLGNYLQHARHDGETTVFPGALLDDEEVIDDPH